MKAMFLSLLLFTTTTSMAESIDVKVNGMVCSMCAQGIQKKFKKVPEVKDLSVDLDNKVVKIESLEGKVVSDEVIKKLITEAGYNVEKIERK